MGTTTRTMVSLRAALLVGGAVLGSFFLGVLAVRADGMALTARAPGGPTRGALSFAGALTGAVPERPVLTFEFKRGATGVRACGPVSTEPVVVDGNGAFSTEVNIGACPTDLFDGQDVVVDIRLGDKLLAGNQPISPVPYAKYADQAGSPDCPAGYQRGSSELKVCYLKDGDKFLDEVVKVGEGRSAFWMDRFEASVFDKIAVDGSQRQFGRTSDDYGPEFPDNGQWTQKRYAVSRGGLTPSSFLTWFQANEACRASGKRLPTGDEWLSAARGTPEPDPAPPEKGGSCRIIGGPPRQTGQGIHCQSASGAQDMIGNLTEWTAEWGAGLGTMAALPEHKNWPDPSYGNDSTLNISSFANARPGSEAVAGLPATALRGGSYGGGSNAGLFHLNMGHAPSYASEGVGFRCVIPR